MLVSVHGDPGWTYFLSGAWMGLICDKEELLTGVAILGDCINEIVLDLLGVMAEKGGSLGKLFGSTTGKL